jgi:16S rRNA (cytosine1402-N4)-methyltransferase
MIDLVVKKPIVPLDEEVRENPRARSAKLRIAEKRA